MTSSFSGRSRQRCSCLYTPGHWRACHGHEEALPIKATTRDQQPSKVSGYERVSSNDLNPSYEPADMGVYCGLVIYWQQRL
jgi:hypothetical protein